MEYTVDNGWPESQKTWKMEKWKKDIEGKLQKKLDNQKATGFNYVDTSVTPTTTIFQAVMEQAVWQQHERHNDPFFQEIRLRRRNWIKKINANVVDIAVVQDQNLRPWWSMDTVQWFHELLEEKEVLPRCSKFFFIPKNVFKVLFCRTNEKDPPTGHAFSPSGSTFPLLQVKA